MYLLIKLNSISRVLCVDQLQERTRSHYASYNPIAPCGVTTDPVEMVNQILHLKDNIHCQVHEL